MILWKCVNGRKIKISYMGFWDKMRVFKIYSSCHVCMCVRVRVTQWGWSGECRGSFDGSGGDVKLVSCNATHRTEIFQSNDKGSRKRKDMGESIIKVKGINRYIIIIIRVHYEGKSVYGFQYRFYYYFVVPRFSLSPGPVI